MEEEVLTWGLGTEIRTEEGVWEEIITSKRFQK